VNLCRFIDKVKRLDNDLQFRSFFSLQPYQLHSFTAMSDRSLIDGFLKGDNQSYKTIKEWIVVVIRSSSKAPGISADDIESDTIYKLLTNLRGGQFRFESSLKTYVQKITRFTLIDALRRNRGIPDGQEVVETAVDPDNFSDALETKEKMVIYQRIHSLMAPDCRDLWRMVFQDELPYAQVAKLLNIGVGAVKTRFHRCKEKAIEIRKKIT